MTDAEIVSAYCEAFVARDHERVEALLDESFRLRDLSPPGFTEIIGRAKALEMLWGFLDQFETVELVDSEVYAFGELVTLRARVRFVHAEAGERLLEQHHLVRVVDGRITAIDELCTGLLTPAAATQSGETLLP